MSRIHVKNVILQEKVALHEKQKRCIQRALYAPFSLVKSIPLKGVTFRNYNGGNQIGKDACTTDACEKNPCKPYQRRIHVKILCNATADSQDFAVKPRSV